jgi:hypothetical protein
MMVGAGKEGMQGGGSFQGSEEVMRRESHHGKGEQKVVDQTIY